MAISDTDKQNFSTILRAAENGRLALIECRDRKTGENIVVIAAVNIIEDENTGENQYDMVPLAQMFTENPYERFDPPGEDEDGDDEQTTKQEQSHEPH